MSLFGFLRGIFRRQATPPPLSTNVYLENKINSHSEGLKELMQRNGEDLELLPYRQRVYVFMGNPPRRFRFGWVANSTANLLGEVCARNNVAQTREALMMSHLRNAYSDTRNARRFTYNLCGKRVTVTDSEVVARRIAKIVDSGPIRADRPGLHTV